MHTLAIAGFGKLGSAIARGALAAGVVRAAEVAVWARSEARQAQACELGLALMPWPAVLQAAPRVMLALKPQVFGEMTAQRPTLQPGALVISVMGGWRAADLGARLGTDRVIRAMPTVAAAQRASTTALCVPDHLTTGDADFAHRLFASVGTVVRLPESLIDAATGACGSGVGFACLFMESLEQAARTLGVPPEEARALALGALRGAAEGVQAGMGPAELRAAVTSPAGTTAAGLEALRAGGFESLVRGAVEAAAARAAQLGAQADRG
jgi:pyrroline-5-carboxylate reductase